MASMRDIKRRKTSIQSTGQITKAMKLVSTAKLQKAKVNAEQARPYFTMMHQTISSILRASNAINHPALKPPSEGGKKIFIVISSNRGLAGGYNGNVGKMTLSREGVKNAYIISAGRKAADYLKRKGMSIDQEFNEVMDMPTYEDASTIGHIVLDKFMKGEVSEVEIIYTAFHSALSQKTVALRLLPMNKDEFKDEELSETPMNYEPSPEAVLSYIIPKYVNSIIYGALRESIASEHGARMTAMDSATNNAVDMIAALELQYNRARQASITQELAEIVGGAEALK